MKYSHIKILLLVLTSFIGNSFAINEVQFIELLQDNHPFFKTQKRIGDGLVVDNKIANAYTDWNFSSTINTSNSDELFDINNSFNKTNTRGEVISIANTLSKDKSFTNEYKNALSLSYAIPLIRDKKGINTTLDTDLALIEQQIGNLQVKIDTNNFINSSLKKFWQMKFLEHKVDTLDTSLNSAKKQLDLINKRFESNLVDKSDVLLQENNYQNQKISLIEAKQELQSIKQALQNLIGVSIISNTLQLEKIINVTNKLNINHLNSIKILELQKTKIHRETHSLNNQSKPKVDLNLGMKTVRNTKSIFGNSIDSDNSLSLGFSIDFPLKSSLNSGRISKKQNELKILDLNKREKILELQDNNHNILMQLDALRKTLDINKKQLIINAMKTQEFEKKYANSNTELRYAIESQTDEQDTRLSYFNNLFKYHSLRLDYENFIL